MKVKIHLSCQFVPINKVKFHVLRISGSWDIKLHLIVVWSAKYANIKWPYWTLHTEKQVLRVTYALVGRIPKYIAECHLFLSIYACKLLQIQFNRPVTGLWILSVWSVFHSLRIDGCSLLYLSFSYVIFSFSAIYMSTDTCQLIMVKYGYVLLQVHYFRSGLQIISHS